MRYVVAAALMLSILGASVLAKPAELPSAGDSELKVLPPLAETFFEAPSIEFARAFRPSAAFESEKPTSPVVPEKLSVNPRQVGPRILR
jgi:hypothetical protein